MKRFLILALSFPILSAHAEAPAKISFKAAGGTTSTHDLKEIKTWAPPRTLEVWEPHEERNTRYEGIPLRAVLDKAFGPRWKESELVLFICADGYQSPVATLRIESEESLLAFRRVDSAFELHPAAEKGKTVPLGPLYLTWDNLRNAAVRAEGPTHWPYQIVGVELANFADKFPHMVPPGTAAAPAQRGFKVFQNSCMACHKMNGEGGDRGPELNVPVSSIEKRKRTWMSAWIDDPSKIRPGTDMPALNRNLSSRKQAIDDLVSYLEEMSRHKAK